MTRLPRVSGALRSGPRHAIIVCLTPRDARLLTSQARNRKATQGDIWGATPDQIGESARFSVPGLADQPQNGDCHQFPPLELDGCPRFAPGATLPRWHPRRRHGLSTAIEFGWSKSIPPPDACQGARWWFGRYTAGWRIERWTASFHELLFDDRQVQSFSCSCC